MTIKENKMVYKVCIPCAGIGSRLGGLTEFLNKSLVSIGTRPTLSHIIDQFPLDTEFVIALGHKGDLIREFMTIAYPHCKVNYVEISNFDGPESGLGLSLQSCKKYLQQPFIFTSCDTLVEETIPPPTENWMGYSTVDNISPYRSISIESEFVKSINEKNNSQITSKNAYIGLAGIFDYHYFWLSMEQGGYDAIMIGEAFGLRSLVTSGVKAYEFTWHDTGNIISLNETRLRYKNKQDPNILDKSNESIWFINNKVIKFSDDINFIANRIKRGYTLSGFVPYINEISLHMYSYIKVEGNVLSEVVNLKLFDLFLNHCINFWELHTYDNNETILFNKSCYSFYYNKTIERVNLFYDISNKIDGTEIINGIQMPKLDTLLKAVDWEWLSKGTPVRFHGDLHFENVLFSEDNNNFIFLDWRQDFAGNLESGDIYYDFAKILHGLIISHEIISANLFSVNWQSNSIQFDFHRKEKLVNCEKYFYTWLELNGYDCKKVKILTAIIFLNISALHHYPYNELLYILGKFMLRNEVACNTRVFQA